MVASPGTAVAADPLPSWRPGAVKQALLSFVAAVTCEGSETLVPEAERVAVFDNDGTLWPEQPLPFQAAFAFAELERAVQRQPALAEDPMVQAALAGDIGTLLSGDQFEGLLRVIAVSHAGMSTEAFSAAVEAWLRAARHPHFDRPYEALTYAPMQELLQLLRVHRFRCFIVSGGGADFMRVWVERVYGIPPERVVGSTGRTRFELRDEGGPVLIKSLETLFVNDGAAKPAGIHQFIGRRPLMAFGNSDGDLAMLQYTTIDNPRPSFGLLLHHTDAEREYAYDAETLSTGRLVEALRQAPGRGWHVVDMQRDWVRVFANG
jgi:phosphoglycolate phosphatase-like HAD superfamily hydrolase